MKKRLSFDEAPKELLRRSPGLTFLLGGPDTGKTTLMKKIAWAYLEAGLAVGLVDADVGQTTIGPPAAIGMAIAKETLPDLSRAQALYFIGSNSPVGHIPEVAIGSFRMADAARAAGTETIVFDSSGLISPPYGRILKYYKTELLRPQIVLALERTDELKSITSWIAGCRKDIELLRVAVPPEARLISAAKRAQNRREAYRRYFADATVKSFSLKDICLYPPHFLEGLDNPAGLLVGLQDEGWRTKALGIIDLVEDDRVDIFAPYPPNMQLYGLIGGYLKLSRSGVELGKARGGLR